MVAERASYNLKQDSLNFVGENPLDSSTMATLWTESIEASLNEEDIHELITKTVQVHSPAIRTAASHVQESLYKSKDTPLAQALVDHHVLFMQISNELADRKGSREDLYSQMLEQERRNVLIQYGRAAFFASPEYFSSIVTEELYKHDTRIKRDAENEAKVVEMD